MDHEDFPVKVVIVQLARYITLLLILKSLLQGEIRKFHPIWVGIQAFLPFLQFVLAILSHIGLDSSLNVLDHLDVLFHVRNKTLAVPSHLKNGDVFLHLGP